MSLCSDCSREVLPIVCVDIDGTLTKYHDELTEHVRRYWDSVPVSTEPWDGIGNFEDYLGVTAQQYREAKLSFRQGGFKRWAAPHDGALRFLKDLRGLQVEVWITTTRPWNRLDSVDPDTQEWLRRHNVKFDHLLYGEDKYGDLSGIVDAARVMAVVEDLPEQAERAAELFVNGTVHLMARPHNTGAQFVRHRTFDQVMSLIQRDLRKLENNKKKRPS